MAAYPGKIMLIEDDPSMRMLLKALLEIDGRTVVSYYDLSSQAGSILDMVRSEHPAIILMDVYLRDVSGIEVLRDIRADGSLDDVRVIMSSGMDLKNECMEAGAADFLLKPYMPEELFSRLPR
jgi:DNA-binding response OmpR family regulator